MIDENPLLTCPGINCASMSFCIYAEINKRKWMLIIEWSPLEDLSIFSRFKMVCHSLSH